MEKLPFFEYIPIGNTQPAYADVVDYLKKCKQAALFLSGFRGGPTPQKIQVDKTIQFLKNADAIRAWIPLHKREYFLPDGHADLIGERVRARADKSRFFHKHGIQDIPELLHIKTKSLNVLIPSPIFLCSTVAIEPWGLVCSACHAHIKDARHNTKQPPLCRTCCESSKFIQVSRVVITFNSNISETEYKALWPEVKRKLASAYLRRLSPTRLKRILPHVKRWQEQYLAGKSIAEIFKTELKRKDYARFRVAYQHKYIKSDFTEADYRMAFRKNISEACRRVKSTQ